MFKCVEGTKYLQRAIPERFRSVQGTDGRPVWEYRPEQQAEGESW